MLRHIFAPLAASAVAIAALSLAPGRSFAYDYVANGGFEAGTASWTVSAGSITSVADPDTIDGMHVGRLTIAPGGSTAIAQPGVISAAPAGTYTLSLSLRSTPGANAVSVTLQLRAGTRQRIITSAVNSTGWQTQQLTVTSTEASDLLAIIQVNGGGGDSVDIDAVSIDGIDPNSVTPTATDASASPIGTPTATLTPTRTATPTKTPTATPDTYVGELRNGDFETASAAGSLLAWDHYGGSMSVATQPVHSGAQSARLESDSDSTKWLYQPVAVDPGGTYAFSAWVYDDDPAVGSAFLRVSWYASSDGSGSALASVDSTTRLDTPDAQFRRLTTGSVTAPPDAHSARLRVMLSPVSSAPAAIYVDDASFAPAAPATATPEAPPTTAAGGGRHSNTSGVLGATGRNGDGSGHGTLAAALRSGQSRVVISEVFYDSAASGSDADNEWIELYNAGDVEQDVGGWTLTDNASSDALPPLPVPAHGYAVVAASDSFLETYPGYGGALAVLGNRIGNSLGNDGDRLALKDGAGSIVDAISWGKDTTVLDPAIVDVPAGHSIERRTPDVDTDTAADFTDNLNPSPGRPFAPPVAHTVKSQPQPSTSGVPIVVGSDASFRTMFLWLALGSASTLVAGAAAWRIAPLVRRRLAR